MGPLQDDPMRDDQREGEYFDGHRFPSEAEWLQLGGPDSGNPAAGNPAAGSAAAGSAAELEVSSDFVDRTLRALRKSTADAHAGAPADGTWAAAGTGLGAGIPAELLRAYAAPEPTIDFVARTVTALRADRRARWRELLARYVAPEPSTEFVARTLSALTVGRRNGEPAGSDRAGSSDTGPDATHWAPSHRAPSHWAHRAGRSWLHRAWPLLAIAAVAMLWWLPWRSPRPPLELRVSQHEPAAFAHSYAATPLPAVLASLSQAADPGALNDGGADGVWLLLGSKQ